MRRAPWLCLLLLAISAAPAQPVGLTPPGVNLRWDNCFGDGGVGNKTFACDENTKRDYLFCSFELVQPLTNVTGLELVLDLSSATPALPAWWTIFTTTGSGGTGCRPASLTAAATLPLIQPESATCMDWGSGAAAGGIAAYNVGAHGPATARISAAVEVASPRTLLAGTEYFALALG